MEKHIRFKHIVVV